MSQANGAPAGGTDGEQEAQLSAEPPQGDPLMESEPDTPDDLEAGDVSSRPEPGDDAAETGPTGVGASVEELIADLERAVGERDQYLDSWRRSQAEFENYRKRVTKQQGDDAARAAGDLVEQLLPVLDACDGAVRHGAVEVEPIFAALLGALEKRGLTRIDPSGEPFDPNLHDAVMHEPAEDDDEGTTVSDVMRPGYGWNGRVLRPAMVKVRG